MTQAGKDRRTTSSSPGSAAGHHRFGSTQHLATEAIAAYVDGELRLNAYLRAAQHLAVCPECAAEVEAQQQARCALRRAPEVSMPMSLLGTLRQIPLGEFGMCHNQGSDLPAQSKRWTLPWRK
ncbi:hypothetical protein FOS14_00465 [Skermania sp. ID1734]|uniref:anti-sigma factor family protein n=1 Tax=Skermania sp. ID1734 TaxID=2597516 RepID=UPI00117E0C93|nr:zf-HC2 domain-containing protein [Skermania sp. ID1734]TSE01906.1 hypothetical protein FOS14_00465 [Skermania sp. ID1734]